MEPRKGLVGSQALIDRVFSSIDSVNGGLALLEEEGLLRSTIPTTCRRAIEGRRRNVTVTLCGDRRGRTPMHTHRGRRT